VITHDIKAAATELRAGGVVAFPTETVYGLGADALDTDAVRKVFSIKGRPANNPMIVHVSSIEMAKQLVTDWPSEAQRLADAFWPGPMTIVLAKSDLVPSIVTGHGETVAIRMPNHKITLELIESFGGPIVGPSANASGTISPTVAAHVEESLGDQITILDGGPCIRGIESTVVRLEHGKASLLRPGVIGSEEIARIVPIAGIDVAADSDAPMPSPGLLAKHYAPKTPTRLVDQIDANALKPGTVVISMMRENKGDWLIPMPTDAAGYAARLYAALHEADTMRADLILIERPTGKGPIWDAVRDRLRRASASS